MPAKKTTKKKANVRLKRLSKLNLWFKHYIDESNPSTFLNKTASARAAGYKASTDDSFRQIGCQNFTKLTKDIGKWMDDQMLSEVALKNKLLNLLNAKETKFFQSEGIVTDEREVEAIETQRKTLDMALKVKDMYAPTKHEVAGKDGKALKWEIEVVHTEKKDSE